jgi:hypothetical protein
MLTAGFRWAPEILPMNKMMAMTVSARRHDRGAVADHPREGVAHHAPAGGRQHQEEGAEQLGEQRRHSWRGSLKSAMRSMT